MLLLLLLLPFPSFLLVSPPVLLPPRARYPLAPPAVCGLLAPGHSGQHSPWHSPWHSTQQGFSPELRGTPSQTRDPVAEG